MSDQIPYGALMHNALRQLVAEVLQGVARDGLPGAHHFFIGFDTKADGVNIPDFLHERFPEEMTIVLQDWFDNLEVKEDGFAVTLNFSNTPERLEIPFLALTTFVDPSVEFGLRFDAQEDTLEGEVPLSLAEAAPKPESKPATEPKKEGDVVSLDQFRKT